MAAQVQVGMRSRTRGPAGPGRTTVVNYCWLMQRLGIRHFHGRRQRGNSHALAQIHVSHTAHRLARRNRSAVAWHNDCKFLVRKISAWRAKPSKRPGPDRSAHRAPGWTYHGNACSPEHRSAKCLSSNPVSRCRSIARRSHPPAWADRWTRYPRHVPVPASISVMNTLRFICSDEASETLGLYPRQEAETHTSSICRSCIGESPVQLKLQVQLLARLQPARCKRESVWRPGLWLHTCRMRSGVVDHPDIRVRTQP